MSENRVKYEEENETSGNGRSIFSFLEDILKYDFSNGELPAKYIPRILFVAVLLIFYIWNTHQSEQRLRKLNDLKVEVEDLRADYTTLKADYMYSSKQSEVARLVEPLGLEENNESPHIIVVDKDEY